MRAAVIQFPGSNCDRDMAVALNKFCSEKKPAQMVWHKESGLPKNLDLVPYQVVFLLVIILDVEQLLQDHP